MGFSYCCRVGKKRTRRQKRLRIEKRKEGRRHYTVGIKGNTTAGLGVWLDTVVVTGVVGSV